VSAVAIFAVAFLLLTGITYVIPSLPPGQLLYEFLKIPQATISIWGISIATLLNSITNGFFWGIVAAALYGLSRHVARRKPLPPMPVASKLATPPPKPMPVDWRVDRYPPAITVRKERGRMEQNIETIEGIGPIRGRMLRSVGINTVDDLLRVGATRLGRLRLAREVGVTYATMLRWVYRGDLLRVRGIGRQYSALLESAGVATASNLSTRNARFLWQTLRVVNKEKKLVRRVPPCKTIEVWVNKAKNLEAIVE
jgi:predicted flap endonuclease-1-like 5' DNA nuclease